MTPFSFARTMPCRDDVDVLVAGGGPAGLAAALAAARSGLRVLLAEQRGQLGGTACSGQVSHWLGGRTADCRKWAVGGIFRELAEAAVARGIALLPMPSEPPAPHSPFGWFAGSNELVAGVPFDPFAMATLLDDTAEKAGVEVLLDTVVADVATRDRRVTHAVLANKGGLFAVAAPAFVDATGDADLAARAGCACELGRSGDGGMGPATLMFHVDNVDQEALAGYINSRGAYRFLDEIKEWAAQGEWPFPYERFISVQMTRPGFLMVNTSRIVGVDGTDGASVSDGYRRARRDNEALLACIRKHIPGCAGATLKSVAPALGIRETRRIRGGECLRAADVVDGRAFPDTIGFSAYVWDLPDPRRPSWQPLHGRADMNISGNLTPLPYRIMVPEALDNLICPGRAVSVERDVLGPVRVMAPCMAMGEAAGHAAWLLRESGGPGFGGVDARALRGRLRAHGAIVDREALLLVDA